MPNKRQGILAGRYDLSSILISTKIHSLLHRGDLFGFKEGGKKQRNEIRNTTTPNADQA